MYDVCNFSVLNQAIIHLVPLKEREFGLFKEIAIFFFFFAAADGGLGSLEKPALANIWKGSARKRWIENELE